MIKEGNKEKINLKRITYSRLLNKTLEIQWLPEIDEWAPLLDKIREKGIKGYVVCGDKDDDCYECNRRFIDLLSSKKIFYEFKIFKGLDHDYPDNFNEILLKAIEFISKS